MRSLAFQRVMIRMALAAMLLLALMPTAGRLWAASQAGANPIPSGWVELCTASGLKRVPLGTPQPEGPHGLAGGGDCAYCPLQHTVLSSAALPVQVPALAPVPAPALRPSLLALQPVARTGLGSRGPPALL